MKQIDRRTFLKNSAFGLSILGLPKTLSNDPKIPFDKSPNFVIIFLDNAGYDYLNRKTCRLVRTPNLNRLATEGVSMKQFYTSAPFTSSSQASLLTGRHTVRNGIVRTLLPTDKVGLPRTEKTLAELLKRKGYKTAFIGRWYLGNSPNYMPEQFGFDYNYVSLNNYETLFNQKLLIKLYTKKVVNFIKISKNNPFFVSLIQTIPYVPFESIKDINNTSKKGFYNELIEEIDSSVGKVLNSLMYLGLINNTLVFFTGNKALSLLNIKDSGIASSLIGGEKTAFNDDLREPFIVRFPRIFPEGVVNNEIGTMMDIFSTCLSSAEIDIPNDRPVDGQNLIPVLQGKSPSKHEFIYYYWKDQLTAIRGGRYKLHFKANSKEWKWEECKPKELYNFETNQTEVCKIPHQKMHIILKLKKEAERFKAEIAHRGENKELISKLLNVS